MIIETTDVPAARTDAVAKPLTRDTSAFRNFAMVWAIASLFHMAHSGIFDTRLNLALLSIAALYVVFKPSLKGFLALILLQLMDVAFRMPNVTNHWIFTAFVNITILHSVLYCVYSKKSFDIDETDVYEIFAPLVRIEVLILYFWAVFHKLNSGFFSEVSCAADLLKAQGVEGLLAAFPQILSLNAYLTILIELAIPVMLFFRKTRHAGILIAFLFHLVLSYSSYNAFFDFTSMVAATYFLFASQDFHRKVDAWRRNAGPGIRAHFNNYSLGKLVMACIGIGIVLGVLAILNKVLHDFKDFHLYFFWTLYSLILIYVMVKFLFRKDQAGHAQRPFRIANIWLIILPVIVFLNGTSPYVGLKTENSYAMFSNLRTEGGITNHFIVPASFQIFDYQADVVEIESSTDSNLQRLADANHLMVLFEFRNYLQKNKPEEVVYRLNGQTKTFRSGETKMTGELRPHSSILSRMMKFRTISKEEPQPCVH